MKWRYRHIKAVVSMEPEVESFEVTDWDLENEFNPNRVRRHQTKHQQIYGIWADDESDDEGTGRPGLGSLSKGKKDFTAPINFVSGGIREIGKNKEEKEENEGEESDKESSEGSSSDEDSHKPQTSRMGRQPFQTSRSSGFAGGGISRQSYIAGLKTAPNVDQDFANWERHTKGIGQKLLLQMGYQPGKGLGKELQGISTPIEAKQRKGKGAIGLYGPEHKQKPISLSQSKVDSGKEDSQEGKFQPPQQHWKKQDGKKVKYVYRSIDEVKADGSLRLQRMDTSQLSRVKVIDMTGPEQRILSGYHQIHQQHTKPLDDRDITATVAPDIQGQQKERAFSLPELSHNLNLLIELTEQDIVRNDQDLQREQNRIINLKHEEERLAEVIQQEEKQIDVLQDLLNNIDRLQKISAETPDPATALTEAAQAFRSMQDNYHEEYKLFELSDLAITIVFPMVSKYLENWDPIKNPAFAQDVFKEWKDLLEEDRAGGVRTSYHNHWDQRQQSQEQDPSSTVTDPYHLLVWEVWVPCIRRAVQSWSVRQCDPLIELLEQWMPLIPPWVLDNVLEQLVFPRLQKEVEEWNPVTDTMPIHAWLHPWLPLMGERLEPLYGPIRHKLSNALTSWHPSDCSAKLILEPWKTVFSRGTMEAFVVTNILPKLCVAMQNFAINPQQQHLDVWQWVMAWEDLLPTQSIVALLEKHFFPRWLQVLCSWLTHNPNYEEVTKWYVGWKSVLSENLLSHPAIKEQFKRALDIMNRAVTLPQAPMGYQPGARENVAYLTNVERQTFDTQADRVYEDYETLAQSQRTSSRASLAISFKDLVEKRAEERGILFMPIPNRYQEGKQVYRFGRILLYLDRGVIFVFNEHTWVPTSLQSLLDMAQ